jgi:hypothetical protein
MPPVRIELTISAGERLTSISKTQRGFLALKGNLLVSQEERCAMEFVFRASIIACSNTVPVRHKYSKNYLCAASPSSVANTS